MTPWAALSRPLWAAQRIRRERSASWSSLPCPSVSVGNLAFGGRGKTPLVAALALRAQTEGLRPGILTRGYGARRVGAAHPLVLVSSTEASAVAAPWLQLLSDGVQHQPAWCWAPRSGDEAAWLAAACPGVPVAVHPRRERGARALLERFDVDVLFLDDAFQSAVGRDLDLVLIDPERDAPLARRSGLLREPPDALSRADLVVVVGCPGAEGPVSPCSASPPEHWVQLERRAGELRRLDDGAPVVPEELGPVWVAAGVGRPATVRRLAEHAGVAVSGRILTRDHRAPSALSRVVANPLRRRRTVLVTEKDAVGWARARPPSPETVVLGHQLKGVEAVWQRVAASLLSMAGRPCGWRDDGEKDHA